MKSIISEKAVKRRTYWVEEMAKPVKDKKIKENIWEYVVGKKQEDQEAKGHPAPFPCELVREHIFFMDKSRRHGS